MLINLKEILEIAEAKQCAIPAFNVYNMETVMGVMQAAESLRAPVIFQVYSRLFDSELGDMLSPVILRAIAGMKVPCAFHLDHGAGEKEVERALRNGATGVMIDASALPFAENVAVTKMISERAGFVGVPIEGELGHVGDNDHAEDDGSIYTSPADAREFAEETGVDALAIAIGTAHGAYKSAPRLDFNRLQEIHGAVSTPLVLHGGSGLSDDDFRKVIAGGITKVNIFTDINYAAAKAAYDGYLAGQGRGGFAQGMTGLCQGMTEAVKQETMKKMRLFGSCGRA